MTDAVPKFACGGSSCLNVLKGGLRMKLKLLAFAFILAFAITSFGALGVSGVSAGPDLTTPGTTVEGPDAACGGALTGFAAVTANTDAPADAGLDADITDCLP